MLADTGGSKILTKINVSGMYSVMQTIIINQNHGRKRRCIYHFKEAPDIEFENMVG